MNMSTSGENHLCPDCGLDLAGRERGRHCPNCLLRLGLADSSAEVEFPLERPVSLPLQSRFFAGYEIIEEISRGGMGVVYKARQLNLNRLVALKMIQTSHLASAETHLRFRLEAEAVAQLDHPHIVSLHETGEFNGIYFHSMNLVEGETLASRIARSPRAAGSDLIQLLIKVCRAVHYAHQRGVLHRDLKPSNILIDAQGEPHVADFGLAKMLGHDAGLTFTESVLGSPNYMAPEQALGRSRDICTAVDVYGLGAVLYELLTGRPPFQAASTVETIRLVADAEPKPPRRIHPPVDLDLETICLKCLQKEPGARYASPEGLAAELERWMNGLPIQARPVGPLGALWRWSKRHAALASLGAALILALTGMAVGAGIATVRISHAERQAAEHWREALLGQARVLRLSAGMGRRTEGLHLVQEAVALGGSEEFRRRARDEWLALAARTEMTFRGNPHWRGSPDPVLNLLDPQFERAASVADQTNVLIRNLAGGGEHLRFSTGSPVSRLEAFSPDGRFLVLRHAGHLSIWDVNNGARMFPGGSDDAPGPSATVPASNPLPAYGFAPNQPLLLLQETPRELVFLQLPEFREIRRMRADPDAQGRWLTWHLLALSPDGQTLAAGRTTSRVVELIDLDSGRVRQLLTNPGRLITMAWSPDGRQLATATTDRRVSVWLTASETFTVFLPPMPAAAHSIAFNSEGTLVAAACEDRFVRLIDTVALSQTFELPSTSHRIAFSPDGTRLGPVHRGGQTGWLELIQPAQFKEFTAGHSSMELTGCQFSSDGRIIAAGNRTNVVLSSVAAGGVLLELSGWRISAFSFEPRGEMVLGAGTPGLFRWKSRWPRLPDLSEQAGKTVFPGSGWRAFGFSPDGEWFAAANVNSNAVFVLDRAFETPAAELGPHAAVDAVALSPGACWAATGSTTDRMIRVWDVREGRELLALAAGAEPQAVFSADGRWLVAFGDALTLLESGSWEERSLSFPSDQPVLGAAAFSPDGGMLAVVVDLFDIQLFDLRTLEPVGLLRPPSPVQINALAFSPDGTRLAAAGAAARLRLWDLACLRQELSNIGLDWHRKSMDETRRENHAGAHNRP